jgi:hypothetical protein
MHQALKNEIESLLSALLKSEPDSESVEGVAVEYLKCLSAESIHSHMPVDFSDFKRFWLESVPWCSELSKRMEKLIMMYEDYMGQGSDTSDGS